MEKVVIGIDGGTESLRAGVFDKTGRMLGSHAHPYETQYPHPGWAEQRPEDWWTAVGAAVRGAVAAAGVGPEQVAALCVDTTCCTVVALDADGAPLRPALLWMDMRSAAQARAVAGVAGDPALVVNQGGAGPVSAEWMLPKSLWLAQCEPGTWARAATICEYQDYMNLRLTGRLVACTNNMAVRWHCDTRRGRPLSLMAALGIPELAAKWPQQEVAPGGLVGGLGEAAAAHLGLAAGTPVAQGGADAFIGMIGLGVVAPGQMALLTGSSHLQLGVVGAEAELHGRGFFGTYRDAVLPGCSVIEGGQTSTGSVINWFKRTLCGPGVSYAELDAEAAAVPPGCEGLTALDHFQGNRTPHTDPLSRGALAGLTLKHGRGHVFRALLESVAAGTALTLRAMSAAGYQLPASITLAGGAARSELWLQIHADMSGVPLRLTRECEAPMLGCAILAAVAAGWYGDVAGGVAAMVHVERQVAPRPAAVAAYAAPLARYAALYPALAPLFHGLHDSVPPPAAAAPAAPAAGTAAAAAAVAAAERAASGGVVSSDAVALELGTAGSDVVVAAAAAADAGNGGVSGGASGARGGGGVILAPSILAADFANLAAAAREAEAAGAGWLHVDAFDGSWTACRNFTVGPPVVAALGRATRLPLDVHLAVAHPGRYIDALIKGGAAGITVHWEIGPETELAVLLGWIRGAGLRAGVALAPDTPLPESLVSLAARGGVDVVLLLAVAPGWGGQAFRPAVLDKVRRLRQAAGPGLHIQVDGGINAVTAAEAVAAGADVLVAGSFLYGHSKGLAAGMDELRAAVASGLAAAAAASKA
ncbi:hypothetical protein HYH02_010908 [Chlamydomonas schloesseri]|uniref:glycerol kinase n=1 Tax=Chlamydomonas schloesseri TaxID=2026947 RepID=A0A835T8R2_9CHLO|nr:hypothetical protein HYH02_010908 [Chlamydomonas schloesseri]|eukprot:KAG2438453.1 hypothetical protein HYH02_010908 [Chlamydomonas schloesseri]